MNGRAIKASTDHKIRVGYVIDYLDHHPGGTERQLLQIINRLNRQYFDPVLISLSPSPGLKRYDVQCRTYCLDYSGFLKLKFVSVLKRFRSILKKEHFHILQTFFLDSLFVTYFATFLLPNRPALVASQRDIGLGTGDLWYHKLYNWYRPFAYKRFEHIAVNSNSIRQHLLKGSKVSASKIKVIYNGIDISGNRRGEPLPEIFRQSKTQLWIGMVANLNPVKRVDIFLKALSILKKKYQILNFQSVILGDGPERDHLLRLSQDLGLQNQVHFAGSVDDVYSYLNRLDLAVLCSDREGFPNSILEYMACALPVVATSAGGSAELVNEANGLCVPPGDARALAHAMAKLAADKELRANLGQQSLKIVKKLYSWDKSIHEWQQFYRSVINRLEFSTPKD